ncbi:MAG: helix-turn-helix transcriptional regulator [Verrucomicrobiaceae bacterium]|nr:helix-turn-helix transcriptional regulator [Verrucomicrobiaceae bacterium]
MKPLPPGKEIFGDWKESPLWARDLAAPGDPAGALPVLPDQVLFLIAASAPVTGRLRDLSPGGRDRLFVVEAGSAALLRLSGALELGFPEVADAVLLGMRHALLEEMFESFRPGLESGVRRLVFAEGGCEPVMVRCHERIPGRIVTDLREAPVSGAARSFWYESQVKALLALLCFVPSDATGEFFCSRQKRLAISRVTKARAFLESHLEETLDLQAMAAAVGCSPFYLSRTFSATTGMTISQYVRKLRIEKAADLLVTGRYNVSEAAVEVGYQSLSHFSKAFQQVKGCLPSKYEAA